MFRYKNTLKKVCEVLKYLGSAFLVMKEEVRVEMGDLTSWPLSVLDALMPRCLVPRVQR